MSLSQCLEISLEISPRKVLIIYSSAYFKMQITGWNYSDTQIHEKQYLSLCVCYLIKPTDIHNILIQYTNIILNSCTCSYDCVQIWECL